MKIIKVYQAMIVKKIRYKKYREGNGRFSPFSISLCKQKLDSLLHSQSFFLFVGSQPVSCCNLPYGDNTIRGFLMTK